LSYEKILSLIVQPVVGVWDEEGNLTGKRLEQPFEVFFPFARSVEDLLIEREREITRQAREKVTR